MKLGLKT